ncbi:DUF6056 family protein [Eisenbergiella sp.]
MDKVMGKSKRNKLTILLTAVYILSLMPVFLCSIYAYPQADDWTYSYRVHLAWEDTHSLTQVLKAVFETVKASYLEWQGTFSSIALMSLQPGVFGEKCYRLVPFLMIGLLTFATLFFLRELCRKLNGSAWVSVSMLVLLVTVQRMVCKPVAFFWYNGAVHYMVMYSFGLMLAACLMKCLRGGKRMPLYQAASCFLAVMLGGGNLVTALTGIVGFASLLCFLIIVKKGRKIKALAAPALFNLCAFALNVAAPGNWLRQDVVGERSNPVMSILRSFYYGIYYPWGEWLDWTVVLFILALIPIAWKMAKKTTFTFPLPFLVAAYSYCFISSMFTPSDFAAHTVNLGRVQNIIFSAHILILGLNIIYFTGWCQKHVQITILLNKRISGFYYGALLCFFAWGFLLFAVPSPDYFTTTLAIHDLADGSAKEMGDAAEKNIAALQGPGKEVDVWEIPKNSALLTSEDIDLWHYGTKLFYKKDKVNVLPRNE